MYKCTICGSNDTGTSPSTNDQNYCSAHRPYAVRAVAVRKDIDNALASNQDSDKAWRACWLYSQLSHEDQLRISLLVALIQERVRDKCMQKRGKYQSGLGAIGSLELLVALLEKGAL